MLSITFDTTNEAFHGDETGETVRTLREIAKKIERGRDAGPVMDLNGNKIGAWAYCPECEPDEEEEDRP